ncbi:MAG TPA: PrsW family intramembrane metalloprotease [Anaerolineales bacterium]|jgi:RsiW-degrading membrane proteinase PrsW (M82 family)
MAFLATLLFGFVPMFIFAYILYWLDRYEKEPIPLLIGVFLWGMLVAAGGAFIINTIFGITVFAMTGSEVASDFATGSFSAPFVEEALKGMAVLLVFLIFRREFDSILDGIVYAGIAALGFAATENVLYIWRGFDSGGWNGLFQLALIRVVLVGWQHPLYTAFTGIGLAVARTNRSVLLKFIAPLLGFGLAMFTHAFHNTMAEIPFFGELTCVVGSFLDWFGVLFMFLVIVWATWVEQRNLINHLREEVQLGLISPAQYRTACSAWAQALARLSSLFGGSYPSTSRFYQVCGELAHKKQQLLTNGDESGNAAIIQRYRAELLHLSPAALA